jgi:dienelactone hydrolase
MLACSSRGGFRSSCVALLILFSLQSVHAQEPHLPDLKRFNYDEGASLDLKEISVQDRNGVSIHDVTYVSPKGGVVPAYLVIPPGKGKFAAILWGHWMMPHSPSANRKEFLEEAIALAPAGVVSLLIDAPYVRPGFKADHVALGPQGPDIVLQQVIDLRRGLDLLLSRPDVDPKRVAYVGHSFDANCGAILDAVDKRLAAVVFMGNPQSTQDFLLNSAKMVGFRKSVPLDKITEYLNTYDWADPATYAASLGPAPALFQYGTHDDYVEVTAAKHYFEMSSGPKEIKFYDSDHALNAEARRDRFDFLRKHLALATLPAGTLEKVPETK